MRSWWRSRTTARAFGWKSANACSSSSTRRADPGGGGARGRGRGSTSAAGPGSDAEEAAAVAARGALERCLVAGEEKLLRSDSGTRQDARLFVVTIADDAAAQRLLERIRAQLAECASLRDANLYAEGSMGEICPAPGAAAVSALSERLTAAIREDLGGAGLREA